MDWRNERVRVSGTKGSSSATPRSRDGKEGNCGIAGRDASLLILLDVLERISTAVDRFQDVMRRDWCDFREDESKRSAVAVRVIFWTQGLDV
jgi:hypothetical protein